MRQKKETKSDIDLKKPVTASSLPTLNENDCFGREWNMEAKDCIFCHDNEFCGLVYSFKIKDKTKQITEAEGGFLDEADFDAVNSQALLERMATGTMTVAELVKEVGLQSRSIDEVALREYVKNLILSNGYMTRDGKILKK